MKKSLSIKSYFTFTKNVFQRNIAYKANTIMFVLGDTMILAVTYYLWKAIYSSSSQGTLNGFSYNDMNAWNSILVYSFLIHFSAFISMKNFYHSTTSITA